MFVEFSERVVVTGAPVLSLATGAHFESGAANVTAQFLGGGATLTKGFWRNDAPNPLLSGIPQPCRAGGGQAAVAGGAFSAYTYANASRPWGDAYCVPGAAAEQRAGERMARSLAFGFDVLPSHRTSRLDYTTVAALTLPSGAAIAGEATGFAARTALPPPGNPLTVRCLRAAWSLSERGLTTRLYPQGELGARGSLSAASRLVVGAPFVCNVSTAFPTRRVTAVGTVIDVLFSWSEPVAVACGAANDAWAPMPPPPPQDAFSPPVWAAPAAVTCPLVALTLSLGAGLNATAALVASAPSVWPPPPGCVSDVAAVLRFRYVARRGDAAQPKPLQYNGRQALQLAGGARIVRAADGADAGTALPPTRFDSASGGVDHFASLAGMRQIVVVIPP